MAKYLVRRGANYSTRVFIPKDLQQHYLGRNGQPRKELLVALKTARPDEAKRLRNSVQAKYDREFAQKRAEVGRKSTALPFSDTVVEHAMWQRYTDILSLGDKQRLTNATEDDLDEVWKALEGEFGEESIAAFRIYESIKDKPEVEAAERAARKSLLEAHVGKGETKSIQEALAKVVAAYRLAIAPKSKEERRLAEALQVAEIEALDESVRRAAGNFKGGGSHPLVKPPTGALPLVAAPGESLMELFDRYATENPNRARSATLDAARLKVGLFSDHIGTFFPPNGIVKKHVRDWKNLLKLWPRKATETKAFRGMTLTETIEANRVVGKPVITPKTINQYLTALGAFCRWLVAEGFLDANPVADMLLKIDEEDSDVLPYTIDQLNQLFRSPLFVGCVAFTPTKAAKSGDLKVRDHHYWLPLIALFTGARSNELCQLLTTDIFQIEDQWVFDITNEGDDDQQLKNDNSKRVVPIHPTLIELGFLTYHQTRMKSGDKWLFPAALPDSRGKRNAAFGKFYGTYSKKIGIKVAEEVNFHSFRHTLTDALRAADFLDDEIAVIIGHKKQTTTSRYGKVKPGSIERRVKIIHALKYPGLELSHLMPSRGQ
ncbi:site-specific integrase [Aestuariivirga litoralis]|uniref:site-specific integrase n=1 Tax=Aestuariivirga litoralis TaxID=2650924 RepID=UPI0018C6B01E|nr:site-specific integrase [Aestuariivirga litoralis]